MTDQLVVTAQMLGALAAILVALGVLGRTILGTYRIAKRIDATNTLVHHELRPNGSSSLRDAVDRIEGKADIAVTQAQEAATHALYASKNAALALERIERFEQTKPSATAIVVTPPHPDPEGAA